MILSTVLKRTFHIQNLFSGSFYSHQNFQGYNWNHQRRAHLETRRQGRCFRSHPLEYAQHLSVFVRFDRWAGVRLRYYFRTRNIGHQAGGFEGEIFGRSCQFGCCLFVDRISDYRFCTAQHRQRIQEPIGYCCGYWCWVQGSCYHQGVHQGRGTFS